MSRFTCKLLVATAAPEDVVKMGAIDKKAALAFVQSFPFKKELARRKQDPTLVAPTITFHDNAAHRYLSIVSDTPGHYSIRRTNPGAGADGIRSMLKLLACISLFFDGNDRELSAYIEHLARESGRP